MEYICDYSGNDYIMFDIEKKRFRIQERSKYDSDLIKFSDKERKKFAMKLALSGMDDKLKDTLYSSKYTEELFKIKVAFYLDDLVVLDDKTEDCVVLDINLLYSSDFHWSNSYTLNININAYFYCSDNDLIVGSKEFDFCLCYKHRCPLELLYSLSGVDIIEDYLDIYLGFLGKNVTDIIENIVNNGFLVKDKSSQDSINKDSIFGLISFNSRLNINKDGKVSHYNILNDADCNY